MWILNYDINVIWLILGKFKCYLIHVKYFKCNKKSNSLKLELQII